MVPQMCGGDSLGNDSGTVEHATQHRPTPLAMGGRGGIVNNDCEANGKGGGMWDSARRDWSRLPSYGPDRSAVARPSLAGDRRGREEGPADGSGEKPFALKR